MSAATIALLGQPNSGKSTLFNALTGLKQHVGNWPGKTIDVAMLEKKLGIPVMLFSATDTKAYGRFYTAMERALKTKSRINVDSLEKEYEKIEGYSEIKERIKENGIPGYTPMWLTVKYIENDKVVSAKLKEALSSGCVSQIESLSRAAGGAIATGECKFKWIDALLDNTVNKAHAEVRLGKLDRIYTHKLFGKPAVVLTVVLGLLASFVPALPVMALGSLVDMLKNVVADALGTAGCPAFLMGLICDVCIQSMGYIIKMLGFVFGVTLVFGLLEEVGVMARISYVFDNTMGKLGLQGKSVMPFPAARHGRSFRCFQRCFSGWGRRWSSLRCCL